MNKKINNSLYNKSMSTKYINMKLIIKYIVHM